MTLGVKYINKKIVVKQIIAYLVVVILFLGTFFAGRIITIKKIGQTSFTESKTIEIPTNWENPYKDLIKDENLKIVKEKYALIYKKQKNINSSSDKLFDTFP